MQSDKISLFLALNKSCAIQQMPVIKELLIQTVQKNYRHQKNDLFEELWGKA